MNNISEFLSHFRQGFQRSARFVCRLTLSDKFLAALLRDADNDNTHLQRAYRLMSAGWLVERARVPSRGFGLTDMAMYGITEHFPYHTEYSPFECSFLMPLVGQNIEKELTGNNIVPRFFNYWQNQIHHVTKGPTTGLDFAFPNDYYATIVLTLLDDQNRGTSAWKFEKAFPSVVSSVEVSWSQPDSFTTLPVTFTYSYWTMVPLADTIFDI